jgi:hypothetical protein
MEYLNIIENNDPQLELYRGIEYENLLRLFIHDCSKLLGKHTFNKKKSPIRTLTNILSSWMFTLYSSYDFKSDPFFPNDYSNMDNLKITLLNFAQSNSAIIDVYSHIDTILNNLKINYNKILLNLSSIPSNIKSSKFEIVKYEKTFNRNKKDILFYKFDLIHNEIIKYNRLYNILNNILLPITVYNKLENKYTGVKSNFDLYVWKMIYRYQLLGSNNNQLAVLPRILNKMKEDFGMNHELFGSSLNFTLDNYCSLYYDIEKYFGSSGSFFNYSISDGVYSFNPPYQSDIIDIGVHKLIKALDDNVNNKLSFILTIPIWDLTGKKIMKYRHPEKIKIEELDYGEFDIIKIIINSKYFKQKLMISKNDFTYLDHNFNLYKNSTIQNTYIFVLSNDSSKDFNKLKNYNFKDY